MKTLVEDHRGGVAQHGLCFQGPDGRPQLVSAEALARVFGAAGSSVKLLVLNACYSEKQAQALLAHVGYVVGMTAVEPRRARSISALLPTGCVEAGNSRGPPIVLFRMRPAALAGLLIAGAWAMPAAADDIDHPAQQRGLLRGTSRTSGAITEEVGFPAHTYLATRDGFARIELDTENLADRPDDNAGRAWRAYLRVITIPDAEHRSDGWSTNGQPGGRRGAHASLIVRVTAGESFTIVATLAQNVVKQQPAAAATYRLAVTELSP